MSDASLAAAPAAIESKQRWAVVALVIAAVAIGFSPIFVRLSDIGPTATAFYRTALGLPLLYLWSANEHHAGRQGDSRSPQSRMLLCLAGFCFAGDLICWHLAIKMTSVANATLLANLAPIFVALGAAMLFAERISGGFALSLAGAVAGSIVLAGGKSAGVGDLTGDALAVLTAVFYAGYFLAVRRVRARVSIAVTMHWTAGVATLLLLPAALISGDRMVPPGLHGWLILLGLAYVCQVGGQSLIGWALAHLPAAYSAVSLLLQPVVAACLAWQLLGESLSWQQALGGVIILVSIVMARRASR